jgi:hypothetical protein
MFPFVGAALGAGIVAVITSLLWPLITTEPRPEPLTKVREVVLQTQQGQSVAQVLGVADEANIVRVDPGTAVAGVVQTVVGSITAGAQKAVASRVIESLANQFDHLTPEDKLQFQERICQPVTVDESTPQPTIEP